jgi:peptide/nickel transport system permease protein
MAGSTLALAIASADKAKARHVSLWQEAWRRFRKHHLAMASLVILSVMIVLVAAGPLIWPVPINEIDFTAKLQGLSLAHPLGTDDLGQDILARMLYGGRISLSVGLADGGGDHRGTIGASPASREGVDAADVAQ